MELILDGTKGTHLIDCDVEIEFNAISDDEILIWIKHASKLTLRGTFTSGTYKIIVFNTSDVDLVINDEFDIKGAHVVLAYGHFSEVAIKHTQNGRLLQPLSHLEFHQYVLALSKVDINQNLTNESKQTSGQMKNYSVCLKKCVFDLKATGKIEKNAIQAKNHQVTKCLTFDDLTKVSVTPLLLINENDVEASHAMSIGQMNENQLFYLQSRGLTNGQISKLVTYGYVLPLSRLFNDEKRNEQLKKLIEERVEYLCLM